MIAEIHKKISKSGSNLTDRLEDNLTGNFFGALRYMPFNLAMKKIIIASVYPQEISEKFNEIDAEAWADNIKFWPYDESGEIDVLLEFENAIIGIEVKYLSGLSSDDEIINFGSSEQPGYENLDSNQQLARESRIISKMGGNKAKVLLFLAKNSCCVNVYEQTVGRNIIDQNVSLGYLSWESVLIELKKMQYYGFVNSYYSVIINDLINLLENKGFDVFRSMEVDNEKAVYEDLYYEFGEIPLAYFDFQENNKEILKERYYDFGSSPTKEFQFENNYMIRSGLHYEFE